ncbi:major facilitator superfamily domain-containing protein 1 isoform X1 [Ixodes scapularis]|uniref:major facilitator superfamily domain-containing protein 1 isoform X1 n=1 Tax=Ixodes scapularis TaxID=6945 RepID=UPI001A9DD719|nr:major facilitator superfamily domain-containing protein 1 isoform X1 [Ixodes scapularis]
MAEDEAHLIRGEQPPALDYPHEDPSRNEDDVEYEMPQSCGKAFCDPSTRAHRFIVLVFLCFLSFGSYYCSDNPGALQTQIENTMAIKTSDFSSLYSWYSWPNTVLCFLGGFLIDRVFGIRMGAIIFSTIIIVGQVVFALGALVNRFWLMQFGRFIFGVGRESLVVAQNAYSVCWFKDKELNTVFGLQLSISRLGSMANFMTMPLLFTSFSKLYSGTTGLGVTLLVAAFWCLLSMLCAVVLAVLDRRAAKILKREAAQTGGVVRLQDVRDFPRTFWMLCFVCVSYYVTLFPFIGLGTVFFQRKFRLGAVEANLVDSTPYLITAFACPVFGILVDLVGRNLLWVTVAVVGTLVSHSLLAFTFINPWVAMVYMGLNYSLLACSFWPLVAMVVPERQLGTAYGMMLSVQNLGLALISMVSGMIVDSSGYFMLCLDSLLTAAHGECHARWRPESGSHKEGLVFLGWMDSIVAMAEKFE